MPLQEVVRRKEGAVVLTKSQHINPLLERVINPMLEPQIDRGAQFIRETRYDFAHVPSRETLAEYGLTFNAWLTLAKRKSSMPGGAASPFAYEDVTTRIEKQKAQGVGKFHAIVEIHGAIAPSPFRTDDVERQYTEGDKAAAFRPNNTLSRGHVGNHTHAELSCGLAQGNTLNLLPKLDDLEEKLLKYGETTTTDIAVTKVIAIATPGSNEPMYRIFEGNAVDSEDNWMRNVKNDSRNYPTEKLLTQAEYDEYLRICAEKGESIVGVGCVDSRQGSLVPEKGQERVNLTSLKDQLKRGFKGMFKSTIIANAGMGHTENMVVPLIGDDEQMDRIAYFAATQPSAVLRHDGPVDKLSSSRPMIFSMDEDVFANHAAEIQEGVGNLFSLIDDADGYRGIGRGIEVFMQSDNEVFRVKMESGIQMIIPDSWVGRILNKIKPGGFKGSFNPQVWDGNMPKGGENNSSILYNRMNLPGTNAFRTLRKIGPNLSEIIKGK